jgi:hypothetical protein
MLTSAQEKFFLGLYGSIAVFKFDDGGKNDTTFADACAFWGINESWHGNVLNQRLETMRVMLEEIQNSVGDNVVELRSRGCISQEDVRLVFSVHEWLSDRFSRHLSLLRNRNGRN